MNAANATGGVPAAGSPREAEAALNAVRVASAVAIGFVLVAYHPLVASDPWIRVALELLALAAGAAALTWMGSRISRGEMASRRWTVGLQCLDVAATLGMIALLDAPLGEVAWALLVVPIVSGAIRLGALGSLLSWAAGCAGYFVLALAGALRAWSSVPELQRAGMLLAVAAILGVLARWLREGWIDQARRSGEIAEREALLSVVERAARGMTGLTGPDLLRACAGHALELGFAAVTVSEPGGGVAHRVVVGACDLVPASERLDIPPRGQVVVTTWLADRARRVVSASVMEPASRHVITGWQRESVTAARAEGLGDLARHAAMAAELGALRAQPREQETRASMTGLADRVDFDRLLSEAARGRDAIAVLVLDLGRAVPTPGEFGPAGTDERLTAAERLAGACRGRGVATRLADDELAVLLTGDEVRCGPVLAHEILGTLARPTPATGHRPGIDVSIGVGAAIAPVDARELMSAADEAACRASEAGGGNVRATIMPSGSGPPTEPARRAHG